MEKPLPEAKAERTTSRRTKVQGFGGYLSGMIMPNIEAFNAWGLITALFVPAGWLPGDSIRRRKKAEMAVHPDQAMIKRFIHLWHRPSPGYRRWSIGKGRINQ